MNMPNQCCVGVGNTSHTFNSHRLVQEVRQKFSQVYMISVHRELAAMCMIDWFALARLRGTCTLRRRTLNFLLSMIIVKLENYNFMF